MRVLLDTDVILDLMLDRPDFADVAAALWEANKQGRFEGYISAITPVNVDYIARKLKGKDAAQQAIAELLASWRICTLDASALQSALVLGMRDYEDAVQHACATASQLDAIVTRNLDDYKGATLPVYSPADFLAQLPTES
jgi:predicted nucleic acid-binding protein